MTKNHGLRRLSLEALEPRVLLAGDLFRSITGEDNNEANPRWGAADTQLIRLAPADYNDGLSSPSGADRPSARAVSNAVVAQSSDVLNSRRLTDFLWAWGQFIDHDLDLTEPAEPAEHFPISVPAGDPHFDPSSTGQQQIPLDRSVYDPATGVTNARQQVNQITAFLDASNVYGSDETRAAALRTLSAGKLQTSDGDLLPYNIAQLPNAMSTSASFFLAGDVRANENALLTSLHTIFMREHNRLAEEIAASDFAGADLSDAAVDEEIYQRARQLVGAHLQSITYNEFLPALLGFGSIPSYEEDGGYNASVNAGVSNEFSTAAFRVGHTMLSSELQLRGPDGSDQGTLDLLNAFFNPTYVEQHGVSELLQGAASQTMQEVDSLIVDDVRNFLFGPPGAGGFDLASLNIQRGRDHGVPSYNAARNAMGLTPVSDFTEISSDAMVVARLQSVYAEVDDVDFWVGGLAEDRLGGSSLGPLFSTVIQDQFHRSRVGDRFYFENTLSLEMVRDITNTRLKDIVERNSLVEGLQENVFLDPSVFYFRPDVGSGVTQLRLDVEAGYLRLRDASDNLLLEQSLVNVEAIVIEGPVDNTEVTLHVVTHQLPNVPTTIAGVGTVSLDRLGPSDVVTFGEGHIQLNGNTITLRDVDQVVSEGRPPVDQLIGPLGNGVSVRDGATGAGYVMYSLAGLADRFSNMAPNAEQLVVVVHQDGQWYYDNNYQLTPFVPDPRDVLLAEVDFDAETVASLEGTIKRVDGISAGYVEGNLQFSFDSTATMGEIDVTGMMFRTLTPATRYELGNVKMGLAANDYATGQAFVLYSVENVFERFSEMPPLAGSSEHLVVVFHSAGQWFYDAAVCDHPFTPRPSDVILADVDYTNDTIVSLQGAVGHRYDIGAGYADGDLQFFANRWGSSYNEGEFRVEGTYFETLAAPKVQVDAGGDLGATPMSMGGGIAARDGAQGTGFVMYSQQPLNARFMIPAGGSDHFVAVVRQNGQWLYDANDRLIPFDPLGSDLLVATIDFTADRVTPLNLAVGEHWGIASGYTGGDLAFVANQYGGSPNAGEFDVEGHYFERQLPRDAVTFNVADSSPGMAARDTASGGGFVLFSQQALSERFSQLMPGVSEHFVVVTHTPSGWHYDDNGSLAPFVPRRDDILLAELDFGNDTATPLMGALGIRHGVQAGYIDGDLQFHVNQFGGVPNDGEFQVTGSYFRSIYPTTRVTVGAVNSGIAVADNAAGAGHLMYSEENVFQRFSSAPPIVGNSNHFVAVLYANGQWHYDNNGGLHPFTPRATDVIVADVDFTTDMVTPLEGAYSNQHGIASGYSEGNLTFFANRWGATYNAGEFRVEGSYFRAKSLLEMTGATIQVGPLGAGVPAADSVGGLGYLMYTEQPPLQRFGSTTAGSAQHLVAVRRINGQWHFDNNGALQAFSPRATDVLLAEFTYGSGQVNSLSGQDDSIGGIHRGYRDGDLLFVANQYGGVANPGEFQVFGEYFIR